MMAIGIRKVQLGTRSRKSSQLAPAFFHLDSACLADFCCIIGQTEKQNALTPKYPVVSLTGCRLAAPPPAICGDARENIENAALQAMSTLAVDACRWMLREAHSAAFRRRSPPRGAGARPEGRSEEGAPGAPRATTH